MNNRIRILMTFIIGTGCGITSSILFARNQISESLLMLLFTILAYIGMFKAIRKEYN